VTPLGLVSRLESALGRFEVELTEERRTVTEVSGWLPGFKARLGDAFPHETELDEKRAEMAELERFARRDRRRARPGDQRRRLTFWRAIDPHPSLKPLS
jgi:hypothetical protein